MRAVDLSRDKLGAQADLGKALGTLRYLGSLTAARARKREAAAGQGQGAQGQGGQARQAAAAAAAGGGGEAGQPSEPVQAAAGAAGGAAAAAMAAPAAPPPSAAEAAGAAAAARVAQHVPADELLCPICQEQVRGQGLAGRRRRRLSKRLRPRQAPPPCLAAASLAGERAGSATLPHAAPAGGGAVRDAALRPHALLPVRGGAGRRAGRRRARRHAPRQLPHLPAAPPGGRHGIRGRRHCRVLRRRLPGLPWWVAWWVRGCTRPGRGGSVWLGA